MEYIMNIVKFTPIDSKYSIFEIHENDEIICEIVTDENKVTRILFSEYSSKIEIMWNEFFQRISEISEKIKSNIEDSKSTENFLRDISK